MARSDRRNRVSPPLMYAFREAHAERDAKKKLDLRDEAGERVLAGRRASARAAITEPKLRREVSLDLETLMNTTNLDSSLPLDRFEHVRSSILNFGFPDVAHRSIDEIGVNDLKGEIAAVLGDFEPRLATKSINVTRDQSVDGTALKVRFIVRADLSCEPINTPVEFIADVELDTGKIVIGRR